MTNIAKWPSTLDPLYVQFTCEPHTCAGLFHIVCFQLLFDLDPNLDHSEFRCVCVCMYVLLYGMWVCNVCRIALNTTHTQLVTSCQHTFTHTRQTLTHQNIHTLSPYSFSPIWWSRPVRWRTWPTHYNVYRTGHQFWAWMMMMMIVMFDLRTVNCTILYYTFFSDRRIHYYIVRCLSSNVYVRVPMS